MQANHANHPVTSTTAATAAKAIRLAILAVGPVLTMIVLTRLPAGTDASTVSTLMVLLWSPLFFSVPALLLQRERDQALPDTSISVRWAKLLWYMAASPQSTVRTETTVSLIAWAALVLQYWPAVLETAAHLI